MAESYASLIDFASSWASAKVAITPYSGTVLDDADVVSFSHSGTVEVGVQKSGGKVKARTEGEVSYESSIVVYRSGLKKLIAALVEAAPEYAKRGNQVKISLIGFDVDVHHSPPGNPAMSHVRSKGCRLLGYSDDMAEGPDADQIELTLNPIENVNVLEDGTEVLLL